MGVIHVRFERMQVTRAEQIEDALAAMYAEGWRVVSHAQDHGEYTFVLERHE